MTVSLGRYNWFFSAHMPFCHFTNDTVRNVGCDPQYQPSWNSYEQSIDGNFESLI